MKTTKRACSLLLALLMMVSLLPAPALAEPAPAFTQQPESGSHVPGESYLLTWELNQTPDRLELVREENVILSEAKDFLIEGFFDCGSCGAFAQNDSAYHGLYLTVFIPTLIIPPVRGYCGKPGWTRSRKVRRSR